MRRLNLFSSMVAAVVCVAGLTLGGCQSLEQRTGWTAERGIDLGPDAKDNVGIGTEITKYRKLAWCPNEGKWKPCELALTERIETDTQSFYNITSPLANSAVAVVVGTKDFGGNASASATANSPRVPQ